MASYNISAHDVSRDQLWDPVPSLYSECLVGKSFPDYLHAKYRKNHHLRQEQIDRAQASYRECALQNFNQQKEMLQALYANASSSDAFGTTEKSFFVIGNNKHLTSLEKQNLGTLSEKPGATGAVFAPKKWSLLKNDTMLLAASHALKECRILHDPKSVNPTIPRSDLWNSKKNLPTIFAREVTILQAAGYSPYYTDAGIVLTCHDFERALNLNFRDLCNAANQISPDCLLQFLNEKTKIIS